MNIGAGVTGGVAFLRNAIGNLGIGLGSRDNSRAGQFEFGLVEDTVAGGMRLSAAIGAGPNIVRATHPGLFEFDSWQHVAFSADGAQLHLYQNGTEVAATDYITGINPADPTVPWLSIGGRLQRANIGDPTSELGPDGVQPQFVLGAIDDLALWTRALSADEVSRITVAGSAGLPLTSIKYESGGNGLTFAAGSVAGGTGSEVVVPMVIHGFADVLTFQFSMHWDPSEATYVGVEGREVCAFSVFDDPSVPWGAPGERSYSGLSTDATGQDFVGIRLGDV